MTKARHDQITTALDTLRSVLAEEQAALENLPESFREGATGEKMATPVAKLEAAISILESIE